MIKLVKNQSGDQFLRRLLEFDIKHVTQEIMTKAETIVNENDFRSLDRVKAVSMAAFALGCYIIGQIDKWNHLKDWIIIEQKKDKRIQDL